MLALALALAVTAAERPKLAVLDLTPSGGTDAAVAQAMNDAITQEVARRGFFEPVSSSELRTLLSVDRQKQLLGCSEGQSCLAEVADALGSRFILSGTLATLGDSYQLSLQVLDSTRAQPLGRSVKLAKDVEQLRAVLPYAVAEACAIPLPAPPSKVLPLTLIVAGGAAVVTAGILTVDAFSRDGQLRSELERPQGLQPLTAYQATAQSIGTEKTIALAVGISGAVLAGAGFLLWPKDPLASSVALVPTGNGAALVGVFP